MDENGGGVLPALQTIHQKQILKGTWLMELVTVIIPAYNAEQFVETAVETVARQSYPNIEIIFVDDCSADKTALLASEKLQKNFAGPWQVIQHERNKERSAARNTGLRAAKGSWIQFLDVDDFLAPAKIEHQMKVAETAPDDVAVVYSAWQTVYYDDGELTHFGQIVEPDVIGKPPIIFLMNNYCVFPNCTLMRRTALEKIGGFDESLSVWEDMSIQARIANSGGHFKRAPSQDPLYLWRWYRGQQRSGNDGARYKTADSTMIWINQLRKVIGDKPISALPLSPKEREELYDDFFYYARRLYRNDREAVPQYLEIMRTLMPEARYPRSPRLLSMLSQTIGYENAEAVVALMRKPKRKLRSMLAGRA